MAAGSDMEGGRRSVEGDEPMKKPLIEGPSSPGGRESISMVVLSTVVAVCGSFEFGICMGYTAPTQSAIISDLNISLSEFSVFGAILNIGAMLGSILSGQVADKGGRKAAMRLSAFVCIVGWLLIYFPETTSLLDTGRFLTGFGIGMFSYVVPVFIAEITPKHLRGGFTTLNQLLICSGVSFSFILGTIVTWRTLALSGAAPCILLLIGIFFIPESPRWLAKAGYEKEFEDALRVLRGKDADISQEADEIREYIAALQHLPKATISDLFQRKYFRLVVIGVGLFVFQQFGGINGVIFYASRTFESAGLPSGDFGTVCMGVIQIPITALGAFLMDRSGRRQLLFISTSGVFTGSLISGLSFYWKDHGIFTDWDPILTLIGMLVFLGSFSLGMGAVPWVIMSEIFPINIKGIAGSVVTLEHWVGSLVLSYSFNFLASWSSSGTFFIFTVVNALALVFIAKFVPETKGRTLEEIQASLNIH